MMIFVIILSFLKFKTALRKEIKISFLFLSPNIFLKTISFVGLANSMAF